MSAYEQKVENPDKNFQYLLFAAEPYETIAFKIPNWEIDRGGAGAETKFFTNWDKDTQTFTVSFNFKSNKTNSAAGSWEDQPLM